MKAGPISREAADRVLTLIGVECTNESDRNRARKLTLLTLESLRAALAGSSSRSANMKS